MLETVHCLRCITHTQYKVWPKCQTISENNNTLMYSGDINLLPMTCDRLDSRHGKYESHNIMGLTLWDFSPCSLVDTHQHYRGTCRLHLQVRTVNCVGRDSTWYRDRRAVSMPMGDGDSQGLSSMRNHTQSPTLHDITSRKTIITTYALLSLLLTVMEESLRLRGTAKSCSVVLWPFVSTLLHLLLLRVY